MKLTKKWLVNRNACAEAVRAFEDQPERDDVKIINLLMEQGRFDWANWLIVRRMKRLNYIRHGIFVVREVLGIYEKKYPENEAPRKAVEAAEKYLKSPTAKNKRTADAVAYAAIYAAGHAAAKKEMQQKIINYGLDLLKLERN